MLLELPLDDAKDDWPPRPHYYEKVQHCARCRCRWPKFWMVPRKVWEFYITPPHRHDILCFACWKAITTKRDNRSFEAREGRPIGIPFPDWYPLEWETGKAMILKRRARHWPADYPAEDTEFGMVV
jgi:hypothetical protein